MSELGPTAAGAVSMSRPATLIREARADELAGLGDVIAEAYAEFEARLSEENWSLMRSSLRKAVLDPGEGVGLVGVIDGSIAGFVKYFAPGHSDSVLFPREWASVRLLAVRPSFRGLGVGRELMRECIARARRESAATLGLHTSELMHRARAMYGRMGFRLVRELEPRFAVRYWLFELPLVSPGSDA